MLLRRRLTTLTRNLSSSSSSIRTKVPILYKAPEIDNPNDNQNNGVTLQVLSWGRGSSGQLGGGTEESRLYPAPVANLIVAKPFVLAEVSGRIYDDCGGKSDGKNETGIGISCGLFHSGLIVDGKLWIWGKGDGGRLGFGHENPAFVPTLNPYLDDPVRCIALGGVHSVALTSGCQLFTWSVLNYEKENKAFYRCVCNCSIDLNIFLSLFK